MEIIKFSTDFPNYYSISCFDAHRGKYIQPELSRKIKDIIV